MLEWSVLPPTERAACLTRAIAHRGPGARSSWPVCSRSGKTWANAHRRIREAVDFLRYYAVEARFDNLAQRRSARWCASARGISAGDLYWPGRRGALPAIPERQAGRADAVVARWR